MRGGGGGNWYIFHKFVNVQLIQYDEKSDFLQSF